MLIQQTMLLSCFMHCPFLSCRTRALTWGYWTRRSCVLITAANRSHAIKDCSKTMRARIASNSSIGPEHKPQVFYRWPTMRHFRFISRFKVYQVSTMLFLLLPMGWWYKMGGISGQTLTYALVSSLGTTGVLTVLSYYFTRVAGELALINDESLIRISTLTFMGGRRNVTYPVSKIIPFSDSQVGGAIQRLEVIGEQDVFLYSLKYGHIIDSKTMCHVLGIKSLL